MPVIRAGWIPPEVPVSRSASAHRPSRRRISVLLPCLIGGALLVGGAAATASAAAQALVVRDELVAAVPEIDALRSSIDPAAPVGVDAAALERAADSVGRAARSTDRLDWWIAERVPVIGTNFEAVRTAAEAADVVVRDVLEPVLALPLDGLTAEGRLDTEKLGSLARASAHALETLQEQVARLDRLNRSALLPQVSEALERVAAPLQEASSLGTTLAPVLRTLPGVLGEGGPRDVVVLFQNSAESRALGGIAGASVLIHLEDGALSVTRSLAAADFIAHGEPVVSLPSDADALYRSDGFALAGTTIHEVTSRPDFSYGARAASALWQESHGIAPDVVIAVDPVALSYLLRATGPVSLEDGSTLTADTVVPQLLNGVYRVDGALSDEANRAQDAYFTSVVRALVADLQGGELDLPQAVGAWVQAVDERRLLAWSADRVEQRAIVLAGVGGVLPETTGEHVPFGLYLADAVGSKLEFYLRQDVSVTAGACAADGSRTVTIASAFTNTIDAEPALDTGEFDYIAGLYEREGLARGQIRLRAMVYLPEGAQIGSFRIDGVETPFTVGSDSGRPVAYTTITVAPGARVSLEADALVPGMGGRTVSFEGTPGVVPTTVQNAVDSCR
ncbi:DUF4012 domain-containing protein [Plantibacter sp. RU18]|uniref:DUF4012 domain-containing protein n=1 Tax=Plantibacter sp. RU18 TaxID=3158143 RepID=UPI003D36363E